MIIIYCIHFLIPLYFLRFSCLCHLIRILEGLKWQNADSKFKKKKNKKRENFKESSQLQENDKKKSRQELMSKTRNEVLAPSEEILAS